MRLTEFCKITEYYVRTLPKADRDVILKTPEPKNSSVHKPSAKGEGSSSSIKSQRKTILLAFPSAQENAQQLNRPDPQLFKVPSPIVPEMVREEVVYNEESPTMMETDDDEKTIDVERTPDSVSESEPAAESAYGSAEEPMSLADQQSDSRNEPIYVDISDPEDGQEGNSSQGLKIIYADEKQEQQKFLTDVKQEKYVYEELSEHESLADGPLELDLPATPSPQPMIKQEQYDGPRPIFQPRAFPNPLLLTPKTTGNNRGNGTRPHVPMYNPYWIPPVLHQSPYREAPGNPPHRASTFVPNRPPFNRPPPPTMDFSHLYPQFPQFEPNNQQVHQQARPPLPPPPRPSHQPPPVQHQRMPPPYQNTFIHPAAYFNPHFAPHLSLYPQREFYQGQYYGSQNINAQQNHVSQSEARNQADSSLNPYQAQGAQNNHRPSYFNHTNFKQ